MTFHADQLHDFEFCSTLEWLDTNGIGGYASSTVSGANTRRYHGLLVASMRPPLERRVVLSKLDERINHNGRIFELSTNQFPGAVHPNGFQYLAEFEKFFFPVFTYEVAGIKMQKTVACVHGENTTVVVYEVTEATSAFTLELLPFCSFKDFHTNSHANDSIYKDFLFEEGLFRTKNYKDSSELFIYVPGSAFKASGDWFYNFEYLRELDRGLDFREDLFNHGRFEITLKKGDTLGVIISTENCEGRTATKLLQAEAQRRQRLIRNCHQPHTQRFALAADQFIATRADGLKTIIAGYHWFSDWGRDTMISLPGLCLVTARFDDAKKILRAFARSVSEGMLPNRFAESGQSPEYNTVDATLWLFHSIYRYYQYTGDRDLMVEMLPVLKDIIAWHDRGTRFNIHVDTDGLVYAGHEGVQLTWMDAKVGDWVVTPRQGKPVEVNALWFNALAITSELLRLTGDETLAGSFAERAEQVKKRFNELYWDTMRGYLLDCVDGNVISDAIRPNQIYALALPFSLVPKENALSILGIVRQRLLTPFGLRSLSPDHADYVRSYGGDPVRRDSAYHQGTVWSHLLGVYIDASMRFIGESAKPECETLVSGFLQHLDEAGVGSVSEIFDAEAPHHPRGCIAQAWSVAEVLRVLVEHDLALTGEVHAKPAKRKRAKV